ncbi:MAG: hypothetical protein IH908_09615 [Proteobacteria bacterium]|nr:hypothetical protein [Pseudomonadota bacterium]
MTSLKQNTELSEERVVRIEQPADHFVLIRAADGSYLGAAGGEGLATFDYVDDQAIWERTADGFGHVVTGLRLKSDEVQANQCMLRSGGLIIGSDGQESQFRYWFANYNFAN